MFVIKYPFNMFETEAYIALESLPYFLGGFFGASFAAGSGLGYIAKRKIGKIEKRQSKECAAEYAKRLSNMGRNGNFISYMFLRKVNKNADKYLGY